MPNPKLIPEPFCSNGLKNAIPATRTPGTAENAVTYADGFPQITMTPVAAGGKPPSGKDMNGILNEISTHIVHANKGNLYQFDAAFAEKTGGYEKGAMLVSNNLDAAFVSLANNNKTNFNATGYAGRWFKIPFAIGNTLSDGRADVPLSAEMGKKLNDEKMPLATHDYHTSGSSDYSKSGFYRSNGGTINEQRLPSMEIHIAHPGYANGAYSRGIGFAYGNAGWGIVTTAWDERGQYRGMKTVLTEENGLMNSGSQTLSNGRFMVQASGSAWAQMAAKGSGDGIIWEVGPDGIGQFTRRDGGNFEGSAGNKAIYKLPAETGTHVLAHREWVSAQIGAATPNAVLLAGNQEIAGTKTFAAKAVFKAGIEVKGGTRGGAVGIDGSGVFLHNAASNKFLRLKHDGTLSYGSDDVLLASRLSSSADTASHTQVATSFAVKEAFDRANRAAPPGTVAFFAMQSAPAGWLAANGAEVSRTSFPALFAAIGTSFGAGNGSTTFKLPDLRGEFVRGWDAGRGVDANRVPGSWQQDDLRSHTHGGVPLKTRDTDRGGANQSDFSLDNIGTTEAAGGAETRPRNVALLACIKV